MLQVDRADESVTAVMKPCSMHTDEMTWKKSRMMSELDASSRSCTAPPNNEWSPQRLPKAASVRVAATLFSNCSSASLSALFNDPPIQKDVRIVFPRTRAIIS